MMATLVSQVGCVESDERTLVGKPISNRCVPKTPRTLPTLVFNDDRDFDVFVEDAKTTLEDMPIEITIADRGRRRRRCSCCRPWRRLLVGLRAFRNQTMTPADEAKDKPQISRISQMTLRKRAEGSVLGLCLICVL